jgi:hypothetical protein
MEQVTLSKEVIALVYNIELNKAGWWDKTVSRLVIAAVWQSDSAVDKSRIKAILTGDFKLDVNNSKLDSILSKLENAGELERANGGSYQIPSVKRIMFDEEIFAAEANQDEAKALFSTLLNSLAIDIPGDEAWATFDSFFLRPLLNEIGSNAHGLIAGEILSTDTKLVEGYLKRFATEQRPLHRELVTAFLDPKSEVIRQYISRLLHARFCIDATGLPEDVLRKLTVSIGRGLKFNVFVDTNFLFSLIGVHENPSNEAAIELKELIGQLKQNPRITLLITPETIQEATNVIDATRQWLNSIPTTEPFLRAALNTGVSGIGEKFIIERLRQGANLTVDDWFNPYLNDFVTMARGNGVELHNAKLDNYSMRGDVLEDINHVLGLEKRRVELLKDRKEKSYEGVKHDMVLWHYVKDKRPAYVESPVDAEDWILTVDYRFMRFDELKQRHLGSKVPICIHPSSMVQMLRFFVPRSKDFEEAMVGTIRLPFLFQEFDAEAQKTSMKILQGIGRFGLSNDATEATVTRVLVNEGLRARIARDSTPEEQLEGIKDALVEEMQERLSAEAAKVSEVTGNLEQKESELIRLKQEMADAEKLIEEERLRALKQLEQEKEAAVRVAKDEYSAERDRLIKEREEYQRKVHHLEHLATLRTKGDEESRQSISADRKAIEEMQAQLADIAESKKRNQAFLRYMLYLSLIIVLTIAAAWQGIDQLPQAVNVLGLWPCRIVGGVIVFVVLHLLLELICGKDQCLQSLWPFQLLKKFRAWLWGVVVVSFLVGLAGNIYSNEVQRKLDLQNQKSLPIDQANDGAELKPLR